MAVEQNATPADQEQLDVLEELVKRAREREIRTGLRNDEIGDLTHDEATELIDQLRRRLGESRG